MQLSVFIVKKIIFNKHKSFSKFITQISVVAIAISITVMVVALSFINGFQAEIKNKAYSFWGHIRIERFVDKNQNITLDTFNTESKTIQKQLEQFKEINFFCPFAQKYGLLISDYSMNGILFKGYDFNFNNQYFSQFLVQGHWLNFQKKDSSYLKEIVISQTISNKLKLSLGQYLIANFIDSTHTQRKRKLKIVGIYKTGIEDYDLNFAFIDLKLIQKLNPIDAAPFDAFEIYLKNINQLDKVNLKIYNNISADWNTKTTREIIPNLFVWLELLDVNKWVLIIILGIIAFINIVAGIITFVLERSRMIGILKTMGIPNFQIQKVFVYYATYISLKGVFIGNIIGLILCALQYKFGIITLNESIYFVQKAPILVDFVQLGIIFIISILLCFIVLIFPSYFINKLHPIKSITIQS